LSELDKEKEELREYDNLDKAKRAIEFNLYDKELSRISIQLEEIENVRSEKIQQQHELYSTLRLQQDKVLQSEESSNHAKIALERLVQKRIEKVKELKDGISRRSALLVNLQEVKDNSAARNAEKQRITSQLQEVNTDIASKQQMLSTLDPQQSAGKQQLDIYRKEYSELRSQADALYGKQGRGRQFSTKKERNAFLAQQIGVLQTQVQGKEERAARMENEISVDEKACEADKRSILSTEKDVTDKHAQLESIMKRVNELTRSRNDLQERRKESWKALETFQEELVEAQGELEKGKQMLRSAVPPHISMGLATVERIVQEKRLSNKQYFGPLIDNFTLRNDAFRTAVEVAAGNSLFHVIVDTDVTAAMLMKELEARKGGRLTFLPLNRLRNENIAYPDSSDVRPLAEIALQYNANVTPAILQVR
jgi:structural maintenance of chromosome 3 (chondroitin sulfate proteoglycan 6)